MIKEHSVLAVITARGGSKGLPRKNVLDAAGKPMVAWSIEAAHGSRFIDRAILSSEDPEIMEIATKAGCEVPFTRPPELALDDSSIYDVLFHAIDSLDQRYDFCVLLQATSPLRVSIDIDACIELCLDSGAPACVSVSQSPKHPSLYFDLVANGRLCAHAGRPDNTERRQNLPAAYALNGAVYVARPSWLREQRSFIGEQTRGHVMPLERSLDVDSALDLTLVRALLAERGEVAGGGPVEDPVR
jgi:CMP-N,N'-diacetyllegionaminic acid synthase